MSQVERWLPVVGSGECYAVSDHGLVRSLDRVITLRNGQRRHLRGVPLIPWPDGRGYLAVYLANRRKRLVHSLVAEAYIGPRPEGMEVRHLDDDGFNNFWRNLAYGTHAENMMDRVLLGNHSQRNRTHCSFAHLLARPNLTRDSIRKGHRSCLACHRATADRNFTISHGRVFDFRLAANDHYCRIMTGAAPEGSRAKLTDAQVRDIRSRYAAGGVLVRELADEYDLNRRYVGELLKGKYRKGVISS